MHFGTIDLLDPILHGLVDGKLDFALDQQQYLIGYMSSVMLMKHIQYGFIPIERSFATGLAVVDHSTAERVLELSAQNIR